MGTAIALGEQTNWIPDYKNNVKIITNIDVFIREEAKTRCRVTLYIKHYLSESQLLLISQLIFLVQNHGGAATVIVLVLVVGFVLLFGLLWIRMIM